MRAEIKGCKLVELPYLEKQIDRENCSILVVGERGGDEGIVELALTRNPSSMVCTDLMECPSGSILDDLRKTDPRVTFEQGDLINFDESRKFDYIVCINVLEHFGLNFSNRPMYTAEFYEEDVIRWNYDLKGLMKMMKLLKDFDSRLIITVPAGPAILQGDLNSSGLPYLRRYDLNRIDIFHKLIHNSGFYFTEEFFWTADFQDWKTVNEKINYVENYTSHNPITPNCIWAFTVAMS